ncbi:MAG TPA: hypothetical protein VEU55_09000 [Gemmatimonadales bacterium]|nr:hypothetical protein [Gemmatimonadales bacterium]
MTLDPARRAGLGAAAVALLAGALTLNHDLVGVFYDDGLYAGSAWALAHGLGYVHPHLPGTPAVVHFPPLYPLVLAPFFGTLPVAAAALAGKVVNVVFAAVAAGLVAWHAARTELLGPGVPAWLPGVVVGAAAAAIPVLTVLTTLLSEPLFAVLLAAAVMLADRPGPTPLEASAAGLAAALALLTRSIGVAAGLGIVLFLVAVRRAAWKTTVGAALPVVVAGLGWALWLLGHGRGLDPDLAADYGTYGDILRQTGLSALGSSTLDLARPLGVLAFAWVPARWVYYVLGLPALAVGLYGLYLLARRSAIGFTLAGYLAILALWPVPPDRFLWAVLPWLALAWAAGAVAVCRVPRLRVPLAALAATVTLGYARYEVKGFGGRWWEVAAQRISTNFAELLPWVADLPEHAVVATDDEALVWLYTRRQAVPLYLFAYRGATLIEPPPAEHRAFLERAHATHALLSGAGASAAQLAGLLAAYPGWLVVVRRWSGGRAGFVMQREH